MKILLTGATGYIGRRLQGILESEETIELLRLFVRNKKMADSRGNPKIDIAQGDTFNRNSLRQALSRIDTAYYLIHSMGSTGGDFENLDRISAQNFLDECINAGVKRIIYIGGLGDKASASKHLRSRLETGEILSSRPDKIQTIWLRAGIIIGPGGASFEIIRNLVQKLPLLIAPSWVSNKTEPISIDDVLSYLSSSKDLELEGNLTADLGSEVMTFREMIKQTSDVFGLKRITIPVPLFTPRLSSYWLILITPVPFKIASALVEGLKSETIKKNTNAEKYFPHIIPRSYRESIKKALQEEENSDVINRFCDGEGTTCTGECSPLSKSTLKASFSYDITSLSPDLIWKNIIKKSGTRGWRPLDLLWKRRGIAEKITDDTGKHRKIKISTNLHISEVPGLWETIDLIDHQRLLLLSQKKIPGKGWLEFILTSREITITVYFIPSGLTGRSYWYMSLPFHHLILREMAKELTKNTGKAG